MIWVRWSRSHTSSSIAISVKSGARRTMRTLSILPSASPMTWAIWASEPGSLSAVTRQLGGEPLGIVRVDVPGHVDPTLVLVVLELGRVDLEDADARRRRISTPTMRSPGTAPPSSNITGRSFLTPRMGSTCCWRPLALPLPGQRNFRPITLGDVEPALLALDPLQRRLAARCRALGELGASGTTARITSPCRQLAAADGGMHFSIDLLRQAVQRPS